MGAVPRKDLDQLHHPSGNSWVKRIRRVCALPQEMLEDLDGSSGVVKLHRQDDRKLPAWFVHPSACCEEQCHSSRILSSDCCVKRMVLVLGIIGAAAAMQLIDFGHG